MLRLVSNKQAGDGSPTRLGWRHIHQHLWSQNHRNWGLNSTSGREEAKTQPTLPYTSQHDMLVHHQLLGGQLAPCAGQARLPEAPNEGEGGEQTSSRMPIAGSASHIPKKIQERTREGWRKAGKAAGSKEGRERSKDILGQSRANRKPGRHTGGHTVLSAASRAQPLLQTQDPGTFEKHQPLLALSLHQRPPPQDSESTSM